MHNVRGIMSECLAAARRIFDVSRVGVALDVVVVGHSTDRENRSVKGVVFFASLCGEQTS